MPPTLTLIPPGSLCARCGHPIHEHACEDPCPCVHGHDYSRHAVELMRAAEAHMLPVRIKGSRQGPDACRCAGWKSEEATP